MSQPDGLFNLCLGEKQRQVFDRDMGRHEHYAKRSADNHHAGLLRPGQVCQQFRVAREMTAGHVDRFFVDRCSDYAVDAAELCQRHGFLDEQYLGCSGFNRRHSAGEPSEGMVKGIEQGKKIRL